jgi:hypothetical protein
MAILLRLWTLDVTEVQLYAHQMGSIWTLLPLWLYRDLFPFRPAESIRHRQIAPFVVAAPAVHDVGAGLNICRF